MLHQLDQLWESNAMKKTVLFIFSSEFYETLAEFTFVKNDN